VPNDEDCEGWDIPEEFEMQKRQVDKEMSFKERKEAYKERLE